MMRSLLVVLALLIASHAGGQLFTCSASSPAVTLGNYTGTQLTHGGIPLSVTCPLVFGYTVSLNAGTGAGATTTTRKLTGPAGATLNYQIFQNASHSINWGTTVGTDTVLGTGTLLTQTLYMYPQLPAGQNNSPGTYTDTITVSVQNLFGTFTTTVTVTATIAANCVLTATALNFGNYAGAKVTANSTVTATCTNTTSFNISLNAGTSAGATVTSRQMTGPSASTLRYNLFRDSALTQNWGMTVGADTLASTGNGLPQNFSVYGVIQAGQSVIPGTYNDTIIATITY